MAGRSQLESGFRASQHVGVNSTLATTPIRYRLQARSLKNGTGTAKRMYATVIPNTKVSQADFCERLARENGKYSAAEYNMIINQVAEALGDELHRGNCVTLNRLGYFSCSLTGSYDPENNAATGQHAVRVGMRIAGSLQDQVNHNACTQCINGSQTCVKADRIEFSMAHSAEADRYEGDREVALNVRPLAGLIALHGLFRNLPENMTATLQELSPDSDAAVGEPADLPFGPYTGGYRRRGKREEIAAVDTAAVAGRLLPGTRWRLQVGCANGEDSVLTFTVMDMPLRTETAKRTAAPGKAPAPKAKSAGRKPRTIQLKAPVRNAFPPPPAAPEGSQADA